MRRRSFIVGSAAAAAALGTYPRNALAASSAFDLNTPTGTIFGTLQMPRSGPAPVALILPGSGPVDRDGNAPSLRLNMYQKLAGALSTGGIATVRYDKRGIGASHLALSSESDLRFETYADDAALWIAKLRADARFSRIALIGHSEGSLLGMLAAKRAPVDAYVSLEGAGFPIATVLRAQLRPRLEAYPELAAAAETILTTLSRGELVPAADVPAGLMALYRPSIQPYVISWLKYDPRVEIKGVTATVTIVQGTHDIQVPVENGRALASARPSAHYVLIDGMTHVLTDDPGTTLAQQLAGADAARPLSAMLARTLITATS